MKNSLENKIKILFEQNHRFGNSDGIEYDYTSPSLKYYPHQWLWDSSFHAIVLSHFDPERAEKEIKTLLLKQEENGFVPCVSIWKRQNLLDAIFYITKITQPPTIPIAVEAIYEKTKDEKFIEDIYSRLRMFMDWLALNRDQNNNGLIEVIHPWETGVDSTPSFDKQLGIRKLNPSFLEVMSRFMFILFRYFLMGWDNERIVRKKIFINENVLMNSIYGKALKSMEALAKATGRLDDSVVFKRRYEQILKSLVEYSWSNKDGIFYDLNEKGEQIKVKTVSGLMPLILDDLPKNIGKELVNHLTNKKEFWSEYPIPFVSMDEKTFNPDKNLVLYRGPSWVDTNWFISKALIKKHFEKESVVIIEKTYKMINENGFWEFYNPLTGEGYGQPNFGWSTLILDMLGDLK